jgi:hypothetical protein
MIKLNIIFIQGFWRQFSKTSLTLNINTWHVDISEHRDLKIQIF